MLTHPTSPSMPTLRDRSFDKYATSSGFSPMPNWQTPVLSWKAFDFWWFARCCLWIRHPQAKTTIKVKLKQLLTASSFPKVGNPRKLMSSYLAGFLSKLRLKCAERFCTSQRMANLRKSIHGPIHAGLSLKKNPGTPKLVGVPLALPFIPTSKGSPQKSMGSFWNQVQNKTNVKRYPKKAPQRMERRNKSNLLVCHAKGLPKNQQSPGKTVRFCMKPLLLSDPLLKA